VNVTGVGIDRRVRANAAASPGAPAILDGAVRVTWAALDARCDAVAVAVRGSGVRSGDVVAILLSTSADAIAAVLGVIRVGAVAAPLPAGFTVRERAAALEVLAPVLELNETFMGAVAAGAPLVPEAPVDPEAPAVIVLTSGTTGRPKGVILSGRAMDASAASWLEMLPPATGWLLALGLGHVAGLGIVWRAITGRVPVRIVGSADAAAMLVALGGEAAPSHVSLVPAQLARLLDAAGDAPPPATVRAVLVGGGPISPDLVRRAARAGWPVIPTYGLSEMGSGVTALSAGEALAAPGTAGRPLPGVTVMIGEPGPDGVGEILVTGQSRSSGYLGETRVEAHEPLRTGDLGRLDDEGRLILVDRRTDRIVRGGENIAPAEVEAVIEAHASIAEVAVVARPDETWGQVPVAAVVLEPGAPDPGDDALAAHARASLAGFKVPVAFARLDVLPRTSGGKLRRDTVRALLVGERAGELARPGGDAIGWRVTGAGPRQILLFHGTLSTAAQLDRLAAAIAEPGDVTVHAIDRRGSGSSRLADPRPLDIAVHISDAIAYLDARGIGRASLVGVSFGGVVALETAARCANHVEAVVAYEPPYGAVADPETLAWFERLAAETADAHARRGPGAAAETFLRAVAGDAAWDRLPARVRAYLEREGDGALADSGLTGLDPEGLRMIKAPVTIITGGVSEPFYAPIADALAARIPGARRDTLPAATHTTPLTDPAAAAAAVRTFLELPA